MNPEVQKPDIRVSFTTVGAIDAAIGAGDTYEIGNVFARLHEKDNKVAHTSSRVAASNAGSQLVNEILDLDPNETIGIILNGGSETITEHYDHFRARSVSYLESVRKEKMKTRQKEKDKETARVKKAKIAYIKGDKSQNIRSRKFPEIPPVTYGDIDLSVNYDVYERSFYNNVSEDQRTEVTVNNGQNGNEPTQMIIVSKSTFMDYLESDQ